MRMLELRREVDLAPEAIDVDARNEIFGKDLYHHASVELPLCGDEDTAHSSTAELSLYGVGISQIGSERFVEIGQ